MGHLKKLRGVAFNPACNRAMICGSLGLTNDFWQLLTDRGLGEGSNARPASFVYEKSFVGSPMNHYISYICLQFGLFTPLSASLGFVALSKSLFIRRSVVPAGSSAYHKLLVGFALSPAVGAGSRGIKKEGFV